MGRRDGDLGKGWENLGVERCGKRSKEGEEDLQQGRKREGTARRESRGRERGRDLGKGRRCACIHPSGPPGIIRIH